MQVAGFILLLSGWLLVLSALVLLGAVAQQTIFVLAGIGVELLGLVLIARCHLVRRKSSR